MKGTFFFFAKFFSQLYGDFTQETLQDTCENLLVRSSYSEIIDLRQKILNSDTKIKRLEFQISQLDGSEFKDHEKEQAARIAKIRKFDYNQVWQRRATLLKTKAPSLKDTTQTLALRKPVDDHLDELRKVFGCNFLDENEEEGEQYQHHPDDAEHGNEGEPLRNGNPPIQSIPEGTSVEKGGADSFQAMRKSQLDPRMVTKLKMENTQLKKNVKELKKKLLHTGAMVSGTASPSVFGGSPAISRLPSVSSSNHNSSHNSSFRRVASVIGSATNSPSGSPVMFDRTQSPTAIRRRKSNSPTRARHSDWLRRDRSGVHTHDANDKDYTDANDKEYTEPDKPVPQRRMQRHSSTPGNLQPGLRMGGRQMERRDAADAPVTVADSADGAHREGDTRCSPSPVRHQRRPPSTRNMGKHAPPLSEGYGNEAFGYHILQEEDEMPHVATQTPKCWWRLRGGGSGSCGGEVEKVSRDEILSTMLPSMNLMVMPMKSSKGATSLQPAARAAWDMPMHVMGDMQQRNMLHMLECNLNQKLDTALACGAGKGGGVSYSRPQSARMPYTGERMKANQSREKLKGHGFSRALAGFSIEYVHTPKPPPEDQQLSIGGVQSARSSRDVMRRASGNFAKHLPSGSTDGSQESSRQLKLKELHIQLTPSLFGAPSNPMGSAVYESSENPSGQGTNPAAVATSVISGFKFPVRSGPGFIKAGAPGVVGAGGGGGESQELFKESET